MVRKYQAGGYDTGKPLIRVVDAISETPKTLTVATKWAGRHSTRRVNKDGNSYDGRYFDSWQEARAALVERSAKSVSNLRAQLASAEAYAAKVDALPLAEPEG